jgi:PncC family amidohydrolase
MNELATDELAAAVLARLTGAGQTLAVAESLTGGLVAAALASVPGASAAFRGGVVAYATDLKAALLGVDAGLLAARGAARRDRGRGHHRGGRPGPG